MKSINEEAYIATYKCNLCGKIIYGAYGTFNPMHEELLRYAHTGEFQSPLLGKYEIHDCRDGSLGLAEFIGFTKGPLEYE